MSEKTQAYRLKRAQDETVEVARHLAREWLEAGRKSGNPNFTQDKRPLSVAVAQETAAFLDQASKHLLARLRAQNRTVARKNGHSEGE